MDDAEKRICEERHKYVNQEQNRHQKWLGTMQEDINKMQDERGVTREAMKNVSNQVKEVKSLQFWIIGLIITNLCAYFFNSVRPGEVTKALAFVSQMIR